MSSLSRKLRYYSAFSVIRWPLLLAVAFGWLAFLNLKDDYYTSASSRFADSVDRTEFLVRHWGFVLLVLLLGLIALGMLSTLLTWVWFLIRRRRPGWSIDLQFGKGKQAVAGKVAAFIGVPGVLRPAFGVVKARIEFSDLLVSPEIAMNENLRDKKKFWRRGIAGRRELPLRDRREYHIVEVQFFFQDMFRMLSLPVLVPVERSMYTISPELPLRDVKADPNKTEEQEIRIPTPKRVEGEIINYKDFEPGDDVRRIVWKIYARTRQLVVRIPETTDPYASHIYLYASFYHGFPKGRREAFDAELLNLYKDQVRNLYESLLQTGMDVRFIPDQETSTNFTVEEHEKQIYHISTAHWQTDRDLKAFVNKKDAAVVCVSSLVPAADVEQLLQELPPNITVVLVKVSDIFRKHRIVKFRDLFFEHRNDPMDAVKRRWLVSGFRRRVLKNEKAIAAALQKSHVNAMNV